MYFDEYSYYRAQGRTAVVKIHHPPSNSSLSVAAFSLQEEYTCLNNVRVEQVVQLLMHVTYKLFSDEPDAVQSFLLVWTPLKTPLD